MLAAELRTMAATTGAQATLTVTNSGPVIPDNQIQRLFQPFQRLATDRYGRRDGHGLGLAIVNAVAHAHHATLITAAPRRRAGHHRPVRAPVALYRCRLGRSAVNSIM